MQETDAAPLLDVISRAEALEQAVAAMPLAVVVIDVEGRVVLWSGAAEELYGWQATEAVGRRARDLIIDPDRAPSADEISQELHEGRRWMGTFPVRRKDGSSFLAWVVNAPVIAADGSMVGMVGMSLDLNGSEPTRMARATVEQRLRGLVDTAHDGIVMVDGDGRVTFANKPMARLLGAAPGSLEGSLAFEFVTPEQVGRAGDLFARLVDGIPQRFEIDLQRVDDGSRVTTEVVAVPLLGAEGEVVGSLGTVTDVTEQRASLVALRQSEERFRRVFHESPLGGSIVADDMTIVSVNEAYARMLGYTVDELVGCCVNDHTHPDDRERGMALAIGMYSGEGEQDYWLEKRYVRRDGEVIHARLWVAALPEPDGSVRHAIALVDDITEQVRLEVAQREADDVHRRTLEAVPDAFIGADRRGRVTDWNPAATSMFGWDAGDVLGEKLVDLIFLPEDRDFYQGRIEAFTQPGATDVPPGLIELVVRDRAGRTFPVELSMVAVQVGGEEQLRAFIRDITARRAYQRDLTDRVLVDHITGLANRTLLADRLEQAIRRVASRASHAAVLYLDVDRFKAVNDSLGHSAGDAVLAAVAARLKAVVGEEHTVARHGGDEFIVLLEELDRPEDALEVAERILAGFSNPIAVAGRRLTVDVSIGLVPVAPSATVDEVIRDADIAMYEAKRLGGGRVVELEAAAVDRAVERLDLEVELRRALATGQITVAFQPVVELDGTVASLEALARWDHPERGAITPAEFIPVAEETGLIVELGARVLHESLDRLAEWRRLPGHERLMVAVNLSGRQLVEPNLVSSVDAALRSRGLPAGALCFEITESMLMEETSIAAQTLDALADRGIALAVDDFGTGYSSLLYLRRFPVHALKLDRSFVSGIGCSHVDEAIVGSMIDLAHSLELVAVAEGVETQAQAEALRARGCDLIQGYLFSRPLPAAELTALLQAGVLS